jgi:outer membrane immunogenic protein
MMKKLIIRGAILAACASGPASAADLPIDSAEYAVRPPIVGLLSWTGFYLGANLGYARSPGNADVTACVVLVAACIANGAPGVPIAIIAVTNGLPNAPGVPLFSLSETMSGVIGGVQAGANWQTGNAVFGIETDFQGTSQSSTSSNAVVDVNGLVDPNMSVIRAVNSDKIKSFGTVRGRVGMASDRWLLYATAGWAYFNWTSNLTISGLGSANLSGFQGGGTAGLGIEALITGNWTVRAEYLYLQSTNISNAPFAVRPDITMNTRFRENVFRIGVNYVFFTGSVGCRPHVC